MMNFSCQLVLHAMSSPDFPQLRWVQLCRCQPPAHAIPTQVDREDASFVSSESCWGEQEDLIGDEIPEWGVLPCPAVLAVQNVHNVDALERDLLVNNVVAEESGPLSSDSGHVAEAREQCQRGPRRLRLQFTGSQGTTVSASWDAPFQFESPATAAAQPMLVNSSDHHEEASPNVHSERGASEWDSGEEHVSEPRSEEAETEEADEDIDVQFLRPAAFRGAFLLVDDWNLTDKLKKRASVMKSVPHCLKGPFRNALRLVLEEASSEDVVRQERGWKLFLLIPRMLLHRPPRGGLISKEKVRERFEVFARGEWNSLLEASSKCEDDAAARRRKRRQQDGLPEPRCWLHWASCRLCDRLWRGRRWRQARATDTLEKLKDETKRPPLPRDPLPPEILDYSPRVPFSLDSGKFLKNVRSAKRGAAGRASGMTVEHLRPLLDLVRDQQLFHKVAERLARADVPPSIVEAIRMGRMTALRKTNGGVLRDRGGRRGEAIGCSNGGPTIGTEC